MTNFRTIFNPSYSFIGILTIIIITILIIFNNKDLKKSFHQIGKISLITSIIIFIISNIIKFTLNIMIPYQYKIFIQVISKNIFWYIMIFSLIGIILGLIFYISSKFFYEKDSKFSKN